MKFLPTIALLLSALFTTASPAAALDDLLQSLQSSAAKPFSADRGRQFWEHKRPAPDGGRARSCSMCHTTDLSRQGEHIRTHKIIKPMAPSSNPRRLTKRRKMRKWLLRNCKFVLGRTCTAQEKGDVLSFIRDFKRP